MWRKKTIGIVTCLAALSLLFGCKKQEEPPVAASQQPTASEQKDTAMEESGSLGEKVYHGTCASCHESGVSGAPNSATNRPGAALWPKIKSFWCKMP